MCLRTAARGFFVNPGNWTRSFIIPTPNNEPFAKALLLRLLRDHNDMQRASKVKKNNRNKLKMKLGKYQPCLFSIQTCVEPVFGANSSLERPLEHALRCAQFEFVASPRWLERACSCTASQKTKRVYINGRELRQKELDICASSCSVIYEFITWP